MTGRRCGFSALNQHGSLPRRWWERVPQPVATVAVKAWSALPYVVRAPFIPLGRWINPDQTTSAVPAGPGPDTVPGAAEISMQGFESLELYTGALWVGQLWPDDHRRSVVDTRSIWLEDSHGDSDGRLWLVRSPWPTLTLEECLNLLWSWVERDHAGLDEEVCRQRVSEALHWDEPKATEWHRQSFR